MNALADFEPFQFVPRQGNGHRGARTGAYAVVRDRRRGVVITEVIEEDFSRALGLAHRGDVSLRRCRHHLFRDSCAKGLHRGPSVLAGERDSHMQSFAASAFQAGIKASFLEPLPQVDSRKFQSFEGNVRRGIKVEDQPVGIVDRVNRRAPGMDLDRAHLDDFQQTFFVLDIEVFVTLAFVPEVEGMDIFAESPPRATLKKTLLSVDAGRTAQQAERVTRDGGSIKGATAA